MCHFKSSFYSTRFFKIIIVVPQTTEPECRVDQDCHSDLACIGERCQNPCRISNPCSGQQKCVVKDTLPTRTLACVCPEGTIFSNQGHCKNGKFKAYFQCL